MNRLSHWRVYPPRSTGLRTPAETPIAARQKNYSASSWPPPHNSPPPCAHSWKPPTSSGNRSSRH